MRPAIAALLIAHASAQNGPQLLLNACLPNATRFQVWTQSANASKLYLEPNGAGTQPMCESSPQLRTAVYEGMTFGYN